MKLFESPQAPKLSEEDRKRLETAADSATADGYSVDMLVRETFFDPEFVESLPAEIRERPEVLKEYLVNTSRFHDLLHEERARAQGDQAGLFGATADAPEVAHEDGRTRHAESGRRIRLDYLRGAGVDPAKVLYFRATQPSDMPKPEYYWTSDFFETLKGLNAEIPEAQRKSAVVLVADLETVSGADGLIEDRNDDNGLPVRQLGTAPFDQASALTKIHPHR